MVLFVGDKPSPRMKPGAPAFEGAACEPRLREWITKLNVYPEIVNQSDPDFVLMVNIALSTKCPIVALGNNASKALAHAPHFKLPHPSARNRQINNDTLVSEKLDACKKYIESFKVPR